MQPPSTLMPSTEVLLGLPLSSAWCVAPVSLHRALTELLDAGSSLVEERVEDDGGDEFQWLVRLTEQGIAARVCIEARWALAIDRHPVGKDLDLDSSGEF
jgi:hypothetical protein